MRVQDKFRYCKIQTEEVEISPDTDRYESIGIDLRSEPVNSEIDRVCCRCGESLSADGQCFDSRYLGWAKLISFARSLELFP